MKMLKVKIRVLAACLLCNIGQHDYFVFVSRHSIEDSSVVLYRISLLWNFFDECLRDRFRKIAK